MNGCSCVQRSAVGPRPRTKRCDIILKNTVMTGFRIYKISFKGTPYRLDLNAITGVLSGSFMADG